MDAVKKTIKRLRGQLKPPPPPPTALEILIAEWKENRKKKEFWEADKTTNREAAFAKAQLIRNQNLEAQRKAREAEEIRQQAITEARLKSLKKARRRLRWMRKQENEDE